jgi:AAA15 family ATPase/GTPase
MLKSLKIKNFRCFEEFDLPQLGRVNLLVGKNNSGKTSILEALHILNSPDSVKPFLDIIECRGEYSLSEKDASKAIFEVRHFFCNHQINNQSYFEILGIDGNKDKIKFNFQLSDTPIGQVRNNLDSEKYGRSRFFASDTILNSEPNYFLIWERIDGYKSLTWLPSGISIYQMTSAYSEDERNSKLVSLTSSDIHTVIEDFNEIVLTPQEEILYESLRIIEPGIDRIAPVSTQRHRGFKNGGFVVSINKQRVPIGSMGYGIWRMLEITLAMVNIPGGTLLIDEIDTGLHFSVMVDLWKLICKTAENLDIQVFATTHNSDCWKSLAEVANYDDIASNDITIHRIERGKNTSIVFNEQEMAIAAERDIEVR